MKIEPQAHPLLTVLQTDVSQQEDADDYPLHTLHSPRSTPLITVPVKMEGSSVKMELDTGAAFFLMSETALDSCSPQSNQSHPQSTCVLNLVSPQRLLAVYTLTLCTITVSMFTSTNSDAQHSKFTETQQVTIAKMDLS